MSSGAKIWTSVPRSNLICSTYKPSKTRQLSAYNGACKPSFCKRPGFARHHKQSHKQEQASNNRGCDIIIL